jgi:hypothetical protein
MGASDRDEIASGHYLTPPERWFASLILESRRNHQPSKSPRLDQNYGPEGIAVRSVGILWGLIGAVVGYVGIALLLLSDGHGPLLHLGYYICVVSMVLEVVSIIRSIQANVVGRRFRGGRPFVRRF